MTTVKNVVNAKSSVEHQRKIKRKIEVRLVLHEDNVVAHKRCAAITAIHNVGFQIFEQPSYSPDVVHSQYLPSVSKIKRPSSQKPCMVNRAKYNFFLRTLNIKNCFIFFSMFASMLGRIICELILIKKNLSKKKRYDFFLR